MNTANLTHQWFQLAGTLVLEILILALALWLLLKTRLSTVWRLTFCKVIMAGVLLVFVSELSGTGREVASWIISIQTSRPHSTISISGFTESQEHPVSLDQPRLSVSQYWDGAGPGPSEVFPLSSSGGPEQIRGEARPDHLILLVCATIWLVGTAILVIRGLIGQFLLAIWRRRCRVIRNIELVSSLATLADALGIKRPIRLVESAELKTPIAFGIFRPTIGLPRDFQERFDATKRDAMIAHELGHLAGNDPRWCLLANALAALLWWHPAVWWLRRRLHVESELAADEASLLITNGPRALSECLIELGARLVRPPAMGGLGASGFRSIIGRRVQRLLKLQETSFRRPDHRKTLLFKILGPIAMAIIVIVCTAWTAPGQMTKGQNMNGKQVKPSLAALTFAAVITGGNITTSLAQAPETAAPAATGALAGAPQKGLPSNRFAFAGAGQRPAAPDDGYPTSAFGHFREHERGARLESKLRDIVLDEVKFDGVPLTEVLRFVSDEARKHDPDKKGINFLIKAGPAARPQTPAEIDPTTGLPSGSPGEAFDVGGTSIRLSLPLRHIDMKDLLDAIVKVADKPIEYTLEDYGVVFSARGTESAVGAPMPAYQPLAVATFRVDRNTFATGVENVFGIKLGAPDARSKDGDRSRQVQSAMRELMSQLGISIEGSKIVFYNEREGMLMVRATPEELDVVRAAVETLGQPDSNQHASTELNPKPSGLTEEQRRFRARYGLAPEPPSSQPRQVQGY